MWYMSNGSQINVGNHFMESNHSLGMLWAFPPLYGVLGELETSHLITRPPPPLDRWRLFHFRSVLPPSRRERGGMYMYNCGKDDLYLLSAILKIKWRERVSDVVQLYILLNLFPHKSRNRHNILDRVEIFCIQHLLPEYLKEAAVWDILPLFSRK